MIELRVQTLPKSSPEKAVRQAVEHLRSECKSMLDQFDAGCAELASSSSSSAQAPFPPAGGKKAHPTREVIQDSDAAYSPSDEGGQRFQQALDAMDHDLGEEQRVYSPSYQPPASPGVEEDLFGDTEMAPAE